jgi:hypothetical protein
LVRGLDNESIGVQGEGRKTRSRRRLFPLASGSAITPVIVAGPCLALPGERGMLSLRESRGKGEQQRAVWQA